MIKVAMSKINLQDKIVKRRSSVTESARFFLSLDKIYLYCSFSRTKDSFLFEFVVGPDKILLELFYTVFKLFIRAC
jgi:hypothetical protein